MFIKIILTKKNKINYPGPTPRWPAVRNSIEARPYNSLPRGQDINSYPSLIVHQVNAKNGKTTPEPPTPASEDVCTDHLNCDSDTVNFHSNPICDAVGNDSGKLTQ